MPRPDVAGTALVLFNWEACFLLLYDAASDTSVNWSNQEPINGQRVTVPIAKDVLNPTPMLRRVLEHGGQLLLRHDETDQAGVSHRFGDMQPRVALADVCALRHQDR